MDKDEITVKELMELAIWLDNFKMDFVKQQKFTEAQALRKAVKAVRELIKQKEPPTQVNQ